MKRILLATTALTLVAAALPARAEPSARVVEARIAAATITSDDTRALVFLTMGEQAAGVPPTPGPVRTACIEVAHHVRRLIDSVCAPASVFVDDLALTAEGSGTFASEVHNEWNQKVADSVLSFSGTWVAELVRTCEPGLDSYNSAPVFIASDVEAATFCTASADVRITSEYFGEQHGTLQGVTGVLLGEHIRG